MKRRDQEALKKEIATCILAQEDAAMLALDTAESIRSTHPTAEVSFCGMHLLTGESTEWQKGYPPQCAAVNACRFHTLRVRIDEGQFSIHACYLHTMGDVFSTSAMSPVLAGEVAPRWSSRLCMVLTSTHHYNHHLSQHTFHVSTTTIDSIHRHANNTVLLLHLTSTQSIHHLSPRSALHYQQASLRQFIQIQQHLPTPSTTTHSIQLHFGRVPSTHTTDIHRSYDLKRLTVHAPQLSLSRFPGLCAYVL
eukprot:4582301-Amphidinium_carterae.1